MRQYGLVFDGEWARWGGGLTDGRAAPLNHTLRTHAYSIIRPATDDPPQPNLWMNSCQEITNARAAAAPRTRAQAVPASTRVNGTRLRTRLPEPPIGVVRP